MKKEILKVIRSIEKKHNVEVVWAIESGSRAWGFESKDSDYDVRCMHVGKKDDYLGLFHPPKQINYFENDLDIESWDVTKFAELMIKSNPQIAEWLRSPIVYIESSARKRLRRLFDAGCSLEFLRQHYLRMAKQNYMKYMGIGKAHPCKKYLYVLRGIACASYIEKNKKLSPLPYSEVIGNLPDFAQKFFKKCIMVKNTTEKAEIMAEKDILDFIDSQINQKFEKNNFEFKKMLELNDLVIRIINKK